MAMPTYALYLKNPVNTGLRSLLPIELTASLAANAVSVLDVQVIYDAQTWQMVNQRDARLYLWRNGRLLARKAWFLRQVTHPLPNLYTFMHDVVTEDGSCAGRWPY